MKYRADYFSLATVGTCLGMLLYGVFGEPQGFLSVLLCSATGLAAFSVLHVNHNHMHVPIFRNAWANQALNACLSVAAGVPVTSFFISHLMNHHPNACNQKDWTGEHLAGSARGPWRVVRYTVMVHWTFLKMNFRQFQGMSPERRISMRIELGAIAGYLVFLGLAGITVKNFLLFNFIPWQIGLNGMIFMNFFVHDGCQSHDEMRNSRTFLSPLSNWITLNNGYHLAHHLRPSLHWSQVPEYYRRELASRVEERYVHRSAGAHFFKHYVRGAPFP